MRWPCAYVALLLAGCSGDGTSTHDLDTGGTTSETVLPLDYSGCGPAMRDPACLGSACGSTAQAAGYLATMLDEVAMAGYAHVFVPTHAEYSPRVDELAIDYQLQVGWFRVATRVHFDVPNTEPLLREEMASHIAGWRVPAAVATPWQVEAAVEACDPRLHYDPCEDHQPDFLVYDRYDWAQPECGDGSPYVVIDAGDASTLECVLGTPQPCG